MILVIPKIELSAGKCKHKVESDFDSNYIYSYFENKPEEFIKLLRKENAKSVLVMDCDSFDGNKLNIESIKYICANTDIPILLETKVKTLIEVEFYLKLGVSRIIHRGVNLDLINEVSEYLQNSRVLLKLNIDEYISNQELLINNNFNRIVLDCQDENITEVLNKIKNLEVKSNARITIYEGITNTKDLLLLNELTSIGIDSVVLGEVFYSNTFPCQKMWREIETKIETEN